MHMRDEWYTCSDAHSSEMVDVCIHLSTKRSLSPVRAPTRYPKWGSPLACMQFGDKVRL